MARFALVLIAIALCSQTDVSLRKALSCSPVAAHANDCKPCVRPGTGEPGKEVENKWPNVTDIELEKTELHLPPPKDGSPPKHPEYSQDMTTTVQTSAVDPENDVLIYQYTISGGRIVGTGARVMWDLNDVLPGTYTITAAVDDGCGLCGAKVTRTVTVLESATGMPPCICSDIRIEVRQPESSNDYILTAHLTGPRRQGLTYNWTISDGTLVSGQGTQSIRVRPPQEHNGRSRTVAVEIGGIDKDKCHCPNSASRSY